MDPAHDQSPSPTPETPPHAAPGDAGAVDVSPTGWREALPDAIRDNPSLVETKSVEDLAQRFLDTKQMVGNSLRMPSLEAGEEDVSAFTDKILANETLGLMRKPDLSDDAKMSEYFNSMGRPDTADGYEVMPGSDPDVHKALAQKAHDIGLTKSQFEELATAQIEVHGGQRDQYQAEQAAEVAEVRKEWGPAFDEKLGRAVTMLELTKAPQALQDALARADVSGDIMRWVDKLATQLGTEGAPMAHDLTPVNADTTLDMRQKRDEVTKRLSTEKLTNAQTAALQERLVSLSTKIMKAEGRE